MVLAFAMILEQIMGWSMVNGNNGTSEKNTLGNYPPVAVYTCFFKAVSLKKQVKKKRALIFAGLSFFTCVIYDPFLYKKKKKIKPTIYRTIV